MDTLDIQTFEGNPKITLTFEHRFIEVSVSVKVLSESYPVTYGFDGDRSEARHSLFLAAASQAVQHIAHAAAESHAAFEEQYQRAMRDHIRDVGQPSDIP